MLGAPSQDVMPRHRLQFTDPLVASLATHMTHLGIPPPDKAPEKTLDTSAVSKNCYGLRGPASHLAQAPSSPFVSDYVVHPYHYEYGYNPMLGH